MSYRVESRSATRTFRKKPISEENHQDTEFCKFKKIVGGSNRRKQTLKNILRDEVPVFLSQTHMETVITENKGRRSQRTRIDSQQSKQKLDLAENLKNTSNMKKGTKLLRSIPNQTLDKSTEKGISVKNSSTVRSEGSKKMNLPRTTEKVKFRESDRLTGSEPESPDKALSSGRENRKASRCCSECKSVIYDREKLRLRGSLGVKVCDTCWDSRKSKEISSPLNTPPYIALVSPQPIKKCLVKLFDVSRQPVPAALDDCLPAELERKHLKRTADKANIISDSAMKKRKTEKLKYSQGQTTKKSSVISTKKETELTGVGSDRTQTERDAKTGQKTHHSISNIKNKKVDFKETLFSRSSDEHKMGKVVDNSERRSSLRAGQAGRISQGSRPKRICVTAKNSSSINAKGIGKQKKLKENIRKQTQYLLLSNSQMVTGHNGVMNNKKQGQNYKRRVELSGQLKVSKGKTASRQKIGTLQSNKKRMAPKQRNVVASHGQVKRGKFIITKNKKRLAKLKSDNTRKGKQPSYTLKKQVIPVSGKLVKNTSKSVIPMDDKRTNKRKLSDEKSPGLGKKMKRSLSLKQQKLSEVSGNAMKNICNVCNQTFDTDADKKQHEISHSGKIPVLVLHKCDSAQGVLSLIREVDFESLDKNLNLFEKGKDLHSQATVSGKGECLPVKEIVRKHTSICGTDGTNTSVESVSSKLKDDVGAKVDIAVKKDHKASESSDGAITLVESVSSELKEAVSTKLNIESIKGVAKKEHEESKSSNASDKCAISGEIEAKISDYPKSVKNRAEISSSCDKVPPDPVSSKPTSQIKNSDEIAVLLEEIFGECSEEDLISASDMTAGSTSLNLQKNTHDLTNPDHSSLERVLRGSLEGNQQDSSSVSVDDNATPKSSNEGAEVSSFSLNTVTSNKDEVPKVVNGSNSEKSIGGKCDGIESKTDGLEEAKIEDEPKNYENNKKPECSNQEKDKVAEHSTELNLKQSELDNNAVVKKIEFQKPLSGNLSNEDKVDAKNITDDKELCLLENTNFIKAVSLDQCPSAELEKDEKSNNRDICANADVIDEVKQSNGNISSLLEGRRTIDSENITVILEDDKSNDSHLANINLKLQEEKTLGSASIEEKTTNCDTLQDIVIKKSEEATCEDSKLSVQEKSDASLDTVMSPMSPVTNEKNEDTSFLIQEKVSKIDSPQDLVHNSSLCATKESEEVMTEKSTRDSVEEKTDASQNMVSSSPSLVTKEPEEAKTEQYSNASVKETTYAVKAVESSSNYTAINISDTEEFSANITRENGEEKDKSNKRVEKQQMLESTEFKSYVTSEEEADINRGSDSVERDVDKINYTLLETKKLNCKGKSKELIALEGAEEGSRVDNDTVTNEDNTLVGDHEHVEVEHEHQVNNDFHKPEGQSLNIEGSMETVNNTCGNIIDSGVDEVTSNESCFFQSLKEKPETENIVSEGCVTFSGQSLSDVPSECDDSKEKLVTMNTVIGDIECSQEENADQVDIGEKINKEETVLHYEDGNHSVGGTKPKKDARNFFELSISEESGVTQTGRKSLDKTFSTNIAVVGDSEFYGQENQNYADRNGKVKLCDNNSFDGRDKENKSLIKNSSKREASKLDYEECTKELFELDGSESLEISKQNQDLSEPSNYAESSTAVIENSSGADSDNQATHLEQTCEELSCNVEEQGKSTNRTSKTDVDVTCVDTMKRNETFREGILSDSLQIDAHAAEVSGVDVSWNANKASNNENLELGAGDNTFVEIIEPHSEHNVKAVNLSDDCNPIIKDDLELSIMSQSIADDLEPISDDEMDFM